LAGGGFGSVVILTPRNEDEGKKEGDEAVGGRGDMSA